jgi:hypothetical protein
VQSGKLDLFLLKTLDGEPAGARHHFLRVEHGRAVFGIDSTRRPSTSVIATATPGTQLLCLSVSALRRATYPLIADGTADALSLLEGWILNLAAAAATGTDPGRHRRTTACWSGKRHPVGRASPGDIAFSVQFRYRSDRWSILFSGVPPRMAATRPRSPTGCYGFSGLAAI